MIIYQNETRYCLSHHGIKDMRWGIMNGPPYPLSRKSDGSLNRQKQDARKEKTIGNMPESSLQKLKKHAEFDEKTQKMIDNAEKMRQRFNERSAEKLVNSIKEEHAAAKAARAQRKEQRKAEKDAAQATAKRLAEEKVRAAEDDEKEALRQYIRHNPTSIYKYADAFTDQEMDDLISRIDMDRKIKDVRDQELRRYKKYLEEGASAVGTISKGAKDVVDLYNNCANVWNAVGEYKQGKDPTGAKDFKPLPTVKNNRGDGDKQKGQTFKQKNPGTVVDDDAAEKKARDKKDKQKQEKLNQNAPQKADQKPAQQAKTDERKESSPKKQTDRSTKIEVVEFEEEVYAHLFEPFTNDDKNHSSVSRKDVKDTYSKLDSNMDKQNFWTTFNNVKDKKIKSNEWTDNDEKNFQIVLDGVIDYYEDHMAHGDLDEDFLEHHGILGMKWGRRRFQNYNGTLTEEGRKRYGHNASEEKIKETIDYLQKEKDYITSNPKMVDDPELLELIDLELADLVKDLKNTKLQDHKNEAKLSGADFYDKDELKAYKDKSSTSLVEDKGKTDRKNVTEAERDLGVAYANMWNNSKSKEEKDRKVNAWERARDKDLYDLTFLEAVQNSKILDDGDTTALLTEYAKYLDHPYEYFMNEADKLKSA